MRKEAVNTFNEGLNFDLNPITTPNNVLTDNINGTFITYNGDELALQNDAGNTKILIPKVNPTDPDEYVQLSPGFYPLGIKEYGGVLYIISANPETQMIEFGSYPSPLVKTKDMNSGKPLTLTEDSPITNINILNDTLFRAGEYIEFTLGPDLNIDNLSKYYKSGTSYVYDYKFYSLKVIQQLENGKIDLTKDIWIKFLDYKETSGSIYNYWFQDPNFKYYCPNNFKGKIGTSLEIEPFKTYGLEYSPILSFDNTTSKYTIEFKVIIDVNSAFTIKANQVYLNYKYNLNDPWTTVSVDINSGSTSIPYIFESSASSGATLYYKITPKYLDFENNLLNENDLPRTFKNDYTINGQRLLSTLFDDIVLTPIAESIVYNSESYDYTQYTLNNRNGDYLSNTLEISTEPYYFYKDGTTQPTNWLASYTIDNDTNKIIIVDYNDALPLSFQDQVTALVENIEARIVDLAILTLVINQDINDTDISITGIGNTKNIYTTNANTYYTKVNKAESCNLLISKLGYLSVTDTFNISADTSYNYAMVGTLSVQYYYIDVSGNVVDGGSPGCIANLYGFFKFEGTSAIYTDSYYTLRYNIVWPSGPTYSDGLPSTINGLTGVMLHDSNPIVNSYRTKREVNVGYYSGVLYCRNGNLPVSCNSVQFLHCPSLSTISTTFRNISDKSHYIINNKTIFLANNII